MKATILHKEKTYKIDFNNPIDISLPIVQGEKSVRAWFVNPVKITPVKAEGFIGDVNSGGSVNFRDITFNPHGNGTHTECVGHISKENYSIAHSLNRFMFLAQVITVNPTEQSGDKTITKDLIEPFLQEDIEAIIIRTLPNHESKKEFNFSDTNAAFLDKSVTTLLKEKNIDHLLIDTPSVDKENDNGVLSAHHDFWEYPENTNRNRTITELIFVDNAIQDGLYFLNLQVANFDNDAAPSRPILYRTY